MGCIEGTGNLSAVAQGLTERQPARDHTQILADGTMLVKENMADSAAAAARVHLRRWLENWRLVNEAQDALVKSESTPDPEASLEAGLSLITFAWSLRTHDQTSPYLREADDDAVRRTWQRLRAAHVR